MNEEKFTSGRGGRREGAGRPIGTTKENKKKPFSFKLSESEEKTVRRIFDDMRHDDVFNYNEKTKLEDGFKPLILELNEKYNGLLDISIHISAILIQTKNENLKKDMPKIIDKFIQWGKEKLNEDYYISLSDPATIVSYDRKIITYRWSIERNIKEDEE